jgi:biotin-[acetyl-CoA-carboxylase] ligase BirA-like protein
MYASPRPSGAKDLKIGSIYRGSYVTSEGKLIGPKKIKNELQTDFFGQEIYSFKEVTSTNDVAKELAIKGAKEGTIVVAETQSRGRGRQDRKWVSPAGGIWFSLILRPKVDPEDAVKLTLMTAAVVAKVISDMFRLRAEVKWPNDIVINGKKVCGILAETRTKGDIVDFVVIGVGINANINLSSFPKHLRKSLTSLREELREDINRKRFLCALLEELEQCYECERIKQIFMQNTTSNCNI